MKSIKILTKYFTVKAKKIAEKFSKRTISLLLGSTHTVLYLIFPPCQ